MPDPRTEETPEPTEREEDTAEAERTEDDDPQPGDTITFRDFALI